MHWCAIIHLLAPSLTHPHTPSLHPSLTQHFFSIHLLTWIHCLVQDAVQRGWFNTSCSPLSGQPDLRTVAMTALEVASAMSFLHSKDIVHGVGFGFLSPIYSSVACSHPIVGASDFNASD